MFKATLLIIILVAYVGTPPTDNTWHTPPGDEWHTFSSGFSPRVHVARLSYLDPLKERHTTLTNITSGRLPQHIRTTDIHYPDMFVWIIDWSKQVLHIITTACHDPHLAICRVKGQDEVTISHVPRSLHMITYHDLCQPPVGWWWPYHHLVSSWQHKISPYH